MRHSALSLALVLSVSACVGSASTVDAGPVDTLEDAVEALQAGGYAIATLSPALYPTEPQPVAVFDVTQPDGRVVRMLAFDPSDADLLRADFRRERPRTGITPGREYNVDYRPRRRAENEPRLFARGEILVTMVPHDQSLELFFDLRQLLGDPSY